MEQQIMRRVLKDLQEKNPFEESKNEIFKAQ
jgi:hypothetical protein